MMSNKQGNENLATSSSSTTSSAKKVPRKSTIVVRHTLTSKLRAERGDKLQFLKNEVQKLSEKQSQTSTSSKESLNSVDKFKKPNKLVFDTKTPATKTNIVNTAFNFKTPVHKLQNVVPKTNSNTVKQTSATIKSKIYDKANDNLIKKQTVKNTSNTQPTNKSKTDLLNNKSNTLNKVKQNVKEDNFRNKISLVPNPIRSSISAKFNQGKLSLLPNQFKVLAKNDENPRRQTIMSHKIDNKRPVLKSAVLNKNIVPSKPTLKVAGAPANVVKKTVTVQSPLRKSLSAMHFKRVSNCNRRSAIHRTMSWSNGLSPSRVSENSGTDKISFRTPSMAKRRSVSVALQTPMSGGKYSMSPFAIISTPTTSDLKRRLSLWLEKRGKPLDSFHHLRCFGIRANTKIVEENKENFEIFVPEINSSYDDLKIEQRPVSIEDNSRNVEIANDAMYDLHKLILEKYPRDQCEAWLEIICSRFSEVQDKPQYWECRAALEDARGNYKCALDCISNAIAKGAEVQNVNAPLDSLLEKFSVLNINQNDSKPNEKQTKAVLDARNVFKSSIINFAIQERNSKKKDEDSCKYTATPVRRSTRISRSAYTTTPNIKICSTLSELDSPVRDNLKFQTNSGFKH